MLVFTLFGDFSDNSNIMAKRTAKRKHWKQIIYKWLLQIAIVNDKSFEKIKGNTNQHWKKLD